MAVALAVDLVGHGGGGAGLGSTAQGEHHVHVAAFVLHEGHAGGGGVDGIDHTGSSGRSGLHGFVVAAGHAGDGSGHRRAVLIHIFGVGIGDFERGGGLAGREVHSVVLAAHVHGDHGVRLRSVRGFDDELHLGGGFIGIHSADVENGGVRVIGHAGDHTAAVPLGCIESERAGNILDGGGIDITALQVHVVRTGGDGHRGRSLAGRDGERVPVGKRNGNVAKAHAVETDGEGHFANIVLGAARAHGKEDVQLFGGLFGIAASAAVFSVDAPAVLPADVDAAESVQTAQQVHIGPFLIVRVVGWLRACRRHELRLAKGGKEICARYFRALHFKHGHVLGSIGNIEVAQRDADAVFQHEDEVVTRTGDFSLAHRELEHEAGIARTFNGVGSFRQIQENGIHMSLQRRSFFVYCCVTKQKKRTVHTGRSFGWKILKKEKPRQAHRSTSSPAWWAADASSFCLTGALGGTFLMSSL